VPQHFPALTHGSAADSRLQLERGICLTADRALLACDARYVALGGLPRHPTWREPSCLLSLSSSHLILASTYCRCDSLGAGPDRFAARRAPGLQQHFPQTRRNHRRRPARLCRLGSQVLTTCAWLCLLHVLHFWRDAGLSFTAKWARVVNVTIQCSLLSASKGCTELEQCDLTCRCVMM
jgi:hypothetical protein